MRKFSSYGPVNTRLHYYAPREDLIETALTGLVGEDPDSGGHYIPVWGPRQTGKTRVMHQVLFRLREDSVFEVNGSIYEKPYQDQTAGVTVIPVFVTTGR